MVSGERQKTFTFTEQTAPKSAAAGGEVTRDVESQSGPDIGTLVRVCVHSLQSCGADTINITVRVTPLVCVNELLPQQFKPGRAYNRPPYYVRSMRLKMNKPCSELRMLQFGQRTRGTSAGNDVHNIKRQQRTA